MSVDPRRALYVSDLDGTLLRSDGSLSPYSVRTLNRLIGEELRFTVASARGCGPIRSALEGLRLSLPVINQNGAFVSDLASGRHLAIHALPRAIARDLWSLLDEAGCRPFLMTFDGGFDRLYYNDAILRNDGMRRFLHDRQRMDDPRLATLDDLSRGLEDQVVCITAIDTLPRVRHLEREMRRRHGGSIDLHCHKEYDPHWHILAVHDARATKDQGVVSIQRVQNLVDCRTVVFGDQVRHVPHGRRSVRGRRRRSRAGRARHRHHRLQRRRRRRALDGTPVGNGFMTPWTCPRMITELGERYTNLDGTRLRGDGSVSL